MTPARETYQSRLDAAGEALIAGDFAALADLFALPCLMCSHDARLVVASVEELMLVMADFRHQLLLRDIRRFERNCIEARFVPGLSDMIVGAHLTRCFSADAEPCVPPYRSDQTLLRTDGGWKLMRSDCAAANAGLVMLSPDIAAAQARADAGTDPQRRPHR